MGRAARAGADPPLGQGGAVQGNLRAVAENPLTDEEMAAIAMLDRDGRLVKGLVFLWPGAKGWEDLWDVDGATTP